MTNIKNIALMMLSVLLIACGGGGSGGGSATGNSASATETYSIDGNDINSIDALHTIGDTSIEMSNKNATPLTIQSIQLDNESDTVKSRSTCLYKNLNQNDTCNIDLDIQGVYYYKANVTMTINTNNGVKKIVLPIWNYNYTNNITDQSKKLQFSTNDTPQSTNGYIGVYKLGIQPIIITNVESSPLYINQLNYYGASMKVDQGSMIPNYVVSNLNTCGGTLLSGASCEIYVSYNAITNGNLVGIDKLEVWYRGASVANKINVSNGVYLQNLLSMDCSSLGNCPIYSKSITEHKLILSSIMIVTPSGIDSTANTDNGCIFGYNFESGVCNIALSLKSYPVGSQVGYVSVYAKYYVDSYHTITFFMFAYGSIHLDNTQTQQFEFMTPPLYANSYFDDNGVFVSNGKMITITNPRNNFKNMTIQKIELIPESTNYQDIDNKLLITSESAISQDKCTGTTLQPTDDKCTLFLAAGMNAWGNMGNLKIDFTIDGNQQVFTTVTTLGKVTDTNLRIVVDDPDPNVSDLLTIWKSGDAIPNVINVIASKKWVGVSIENLANDSGTYVILDNFTGVQTSVIPDCRGYTAKTQHYMYPSKNYYCAYEIDVTNQVGQNIPMRLILGNHKEVQLNLNWQVIAPTTSYVKPIFKGSVK